MIKMYAMYLLVMIEINGKSVLLLSFFRCKRNQFIFCQNMTNTLETYKTIIIMAKNVNEKKNGVKTNIF